MRLSDAMRLGAMLKPQGFGMGFNARDGSTCALGAALDAVNELGAGELVPQALAVEWNLVHVQTRPCPACISGYFGGTIPHLNDDHRWTREQIADWVATLEPADPHAGDRALEVAVRIEVQR